MNFFGKNRTYFGKKAPVPAQSPSPSERILTDLRQQYVQFCESPIVSPKTSEREFEELCALDSVSKITFGKDLNDPCLLIQTKGVILQNRHTGNYHDIGEMIFVMRRRPNAEIYFYNATRIVCVNMQSYVGSYHHPHVTADGIICSNYLNFIMQELAAGKVLSATIAAIDAVNTYGPNMPYCDILKWPIVKLLPEDQDD